ncbi:MAG: SGNH/GDSL hydrolase family protein [Deltaproteobacteria bacterium]|nr:SGNH/GDSL hydrolase family protein [Deltaproteobacteria bacterium]
MKESKTLFEKNPKKTYLLVFFCILVFLFFVDFLLGQFFLGKVFSSDVAGYVVPHHYYHHDHGVPKNSKRSLKWGPLEYLHVSNSLGFKDSGLRKIEGKTEKHRILFLGDSFIEGLGYPYESTCIGLFDRILDGEQYDVLNAAVTSYSPKLYRLKLKYLIDVVGLKVDEVFVFIDISDIQDEIVYEHFSPSPLPLRDRITNVLMKNFYCIHHASILLRKWKHIPSKETKGPAPPKRPSGEYDFWGNYYADRGKWLYDKKIFDLWGRKGLRLASENIHKLHVLCKIHRIGLHLAVYPWPENIRAPERNGTHTEHWRKFAEERHIGFIDLFPLFIDDRDPQEVIEDLFIPGDSHWNEKGHRVIADTLYRYWGKHSSESRPPLSRPGGKASSQNMGG